MIFFVVQKHIKNRCRINVGKSFVLYFLLFLLSILFILCYGSNGISFKYNILVLIHSFLIIFPCLYPATYFPCLSSYSFLSTVNTFKSSEESFSSSNNTIISGGYGTNYSIHYCLKLTV